MTPSLKLDNQLCFRLYTASRLITQAYHPLLEPLGLTYPQYLVMLVLWERDNQTVGDIARRLKLETNTITPLIKRMEQANLLDRSKGKTDSRQTIVSLSWRGRELEERAQQIPECMIDTLQCTTDDTSELKQMANLLDKLIARVDSRQKNVNGS